MTNTQNPKLLTPLLMGKVEKRVRTLLDHAAKIWPELTDKFSVMPEIRYDIKNRFGGIAITGGKDDWVIRLNLILCYENEEHFIEQTVGHEVAHLVQRAVFGSTKMVMDSAGKTVIKRVRSHGPEWRAVMTKFKLVPRVTHTYDTSSIQVKKRVRAKRGAKLNISQTAEMMKRLETGFRRLDDNAMLSFFQTHFGKMTQSTRSLFVEWVDNFGDES